MLALLVLAFFCSIFIIIPIAVLWIGHAGYRKRTMQGKPNKITVALIVLFEVAIVGSYLFMFWQPWFVEKSFVYMEIVFGAYGFLLFWIPVLTPFAIPYLFNTLRENRRKKLAIVLSIELIIAAIWIVLIASALFGIPFELRDDFMVAR